MAGHPRLKEIICDDLEEILNNAPGVRGRPGRLREVNQLKKEK
jgi:predicted component of type VI protein secretion system